MTDLQRKNLSVQKDPPSLEFNGRPSLVVKNNESDPETHSLNKHMHLINQERLNPTPLDSFGIQKSGNLRSLDCLSSNYEPIVDEIRELAEFPDGWDGPDSKGPSDDVIADVINFLRFWNIEVGILEPELAYDGTIALQMYESNGYTRGGIRFLGKNRGIYSIVNRTKLIASKEFDSKVDSEIEQSVKEIENALEESDSI